MYLGQLMLMKRLAKDAENTSSHVLTITEKRMSDVRMSTTDNYQGEESDIVMLHLTVQFFYLFFLVLSAIYLRYELHSRHTFVEKDKAE
jgi:hypothetical protein